MGGFSSGASYNQSNSKASSRDNVWGTQGKALGDLYDSAESTFGNTGWAGEMLQGQIPGMLGQMGQVSDGSIGANQNLLGGGSVGNTDAIRNNLLSSLNNTANSPSNTSLMYQSIVGGEGNGYIDPVVSAMKDSQVDNLKRMQSSAGMDAAAMGQSGSSRHAMENAMLGSEANQNMLALESDLRAGAYDKDLSMKMNIASLADQNVAGSQDRMLEMLGMADSSRQTGISNTPGLQDGIMGQAAPIRNAVDGSWDSARNWSDILGGPTVLNSSSAKANSWGTSKSSSAQVGSKG